MASKNGKIKRIVQIKKMLRKGLDRKDIIQKLSKTCKLTERTFDNEIKEAKEAIAIENKQAEEIRQATISKQLKEEINASILSDLELDLILSKIAGAEISIEEYLKGGVVTRNVTPIEQIAAIDKLFKRRGSYAPTKSAQTDVKGNDIFLMSIDPLKQTDATEDDSIA